MARRWDEKEVPFSKVEKSKSAKENKWTRCERLRENECKPFVQIVVEVGI